MIVANKELFRSRFTTVVRIEVQTKEGPVVSDVFFYGSFPEDVKERLDAEGLLEGAEINSGSLRNGVERAIKNMPSIGANIDRDWETSVEKDI